MQAGLFEEGEILASVEVPRRVLIAAYARRLLRENNHPSLSEENPRRQENAKRQAERDIGRIFAACFQEGLTITVTAAEKRRG